MTAAAFHVWGTGTAWTMRVYRALHESGCDSASHPVRTRTMDMESNQASGKLVVRVRPD